MGEGRENEMRMKRRDSRETTGYCKRKEEMEEVETEGGGNIRKKKFRERREIRFRDETWGLKGRFIPAW